VAEDLDALLVKMLDDAGQLRREAQHALEMRGKTGLQRRLNAPRNIGPRFQGVIYRRQDTMEAGKLENIVPVKAVVNQLVETRRAA
jgi:hypothetical protein